MKFKLTHALVFLLCLFGTLYLIGTFLETLITPLSDLWANLFASMIVVLGIEKIIHRVRIQKNKQSIRYVKGRLFTILADIMRYSRAPSNWKENLANPEYDWEPYVNKLACATTFSVKKLENIIDCFSYLLEPELMNDMFLLVSVLRLSISDFSSALNRSVVFISESRKIIESHELLKYMGIMMRFKKGELPEIRLGKEKMGISEQNQLRHYSEWLDEIIKFRDEYTEKYELKRMREHL